MISGDHWNRVFNAFHVGIIGCLTVLSSKSSAVFLSCNGLSDSGLGSSLTKLSDIGTSEVLGKLGAEIEGDVGGHWTLSKVGLEDVHTG